MPRTIGKPAAKPVAILALLAGCVAAGCASPPAASMAVEFAAGPVAIDGLLREPDWAGARCLPLAGRRSYGQARLLWDREFLYVAVECRLADRISQDSLILQLVGRRRVHFKFEPDGHCWDLRSAGPRSAILQPQILDYATYAHGKQQWTVEARVPLMAFGAVGSPVRLRLARLGAYRPPAKGAAPEPVRSEHTRRLVFNLPRADAGGGRAASRPARQRA